MMNQGDVTRSDRWSRRSFGLLFDKRGVCLTELMVSLTAGVIILAAALNAFNVAQTHASKQQKDLRHQQDLRLGLEVFEQEARLAVAESIVSATADEFRFHANISAHRTMTTGPVVPGQSVITVQDGSGWSEGKTINICGNQTCEAHQLSRSGQRYQLTLTEPAASLFSAGASVEVNNRVVYYTKRDESGRIKLMRMVDGGANTLIGDLDDLHFSYWDEHGHVTQQPSLVKRVVLEIESNHSLHRMMREVSLRS
jgi:type II secretory pathway component PulJ